MHLLQIASPLASRLIDHVINIRTHTHTQIYEQQPACKEVVGRRGRGGGDGADGRWTQTQSIMREALGEWVGVCVTTHANTPTAAASITTTLIPTSLPPTPCPPPLRVHATHTYARTRTHPRTRAKLGVALAREEEDDDHDASRRAVA